MADQVSAFMSFPLWHRAGQGGDRHLFCGQFFPEKVVNDPVHPTADRGLFCGHGRANFPDILELLNGYLAYHVLFCGQLALLAGENPASVVPADIVRMPLPVVLPVVRVAPGPCANLGATVPIISRVTNLPASVGLGMLGLAADRIVTGDLMAAGSCIRQIPTAAKPTTFLFDLHGSIPSLVADEVTLPLRVTKNKLENAEKMFPRRCSQNEQF